MINKGITISIVSHKQFGIMKKLLHQLVHYEKYIHKIIITINVPEYIDKDNFYKSDIFLWIFNDKPLGFGENHNNAFLEAKSMFFCILNPDIFFVEDVFVKLIKKKIKHNIGIIAPSLIDLNKIPQVNSRSFPSFYGILKKIFYKKDEIYYFAKKDELIFTNWVGGMFMLMNTSDYELLGGFDERYFLYLEDVDLCLMANKKGLSVAECTDILIGHEARRTSRKKFRYFIIHLKSYIKFFFKYGFK